MSKRKYLKLNPSTIFNISPDQTFIRPTSINITLENRGKDFKLNYKETYRNKQPPENQDWMIETTLNTFRRIQEEVRKYQKYFFYQIKAIKKGYEILVICDDIFALFAGILAELMAFGLRNKEDTHNFLPLAETLLKLVSKADIIDE